MPGIYSEKCKVESGKHGFTLVELLVVMAILAILATFTSIVYGGYQKNARDAVRKQDLADIQISLKAYFDNKGHYPVQNTLHILGGFLFACKDNVDGNISWTAIVPGEPWICYEDQNPTEYMKLYPKDPKTWKFGGMINAGYMYLPKSKYLTTDPADYCLNDNECPYFELVTCLENLKDPDGTPGGLIYVAGTNSEWHCPDDRSLYKITGP